MADDRTNLLYGPLLRLRETLAALPAFQAFCGEAVTDADDPAVAAAGHIYCPAMTDDVRTARPFAVCSLAEGPRLPDALAGGEAGGVLWLLLEADTPAAVADDETAAYRWFCAVCGDVCADLLTASWSIADALDVRVINVEAPPARSTAAAREGDFFQTILAVQWGVAP